LLQRSKKIAGESTLSRNEQDDLLQRLGYYLVEATEGAEISPRWEIDPKPGHRDISMAAGRNMRYVSLSHNSTLGDYARWADNNRGEPVELGPFQNRHSWVFYGLPVPYCDNYGPDSAEIYLNRAKVNFGNYNGDLAYIDIGKGLHYVSDLGCPYHTSGAAYQAYHVFYEDWTQENWDLFESAMDSNVYYLTCGGKGGGSRSPWSSGRE
jgi:hypothetical protein